MRIRPVVLALALIVAVVTAGCSSKQNEGAPAQPEPTATVDPATAGTITGSVTFHGTPPQYHAIDMSAESACVEANPRPVIPPVVIVGAHGALANSVVYIKSGLGAYRYSTPTEPAVLDQKACMYVPRILAFRAGQPFEIKNTDPVTHNIHPIPRENKRWNRSLAANEAPFITNFPYPELAIPVVCNIHPWMRAYLFVFDHPYFEVTPETGAFELQNVPPGTYTIEVWHERFGTLDQTVTLAPKGSKEISFEFTGSK